MDLALKPVQFGSIRRVEGTAYPVFIFGHGDWGCLWRRSLINVMKRDCRVPHSFAFFANGWV